MNDDLGKRMKEHYEDRTRMKLPRRTYTVIRVDGKAFHTFTRGYQRPFDPTLMSMMDKTAVALCKGIQGAVLGYVQSDEISVVLTDFATPQTEAWFDGNVQKMTSISAAIATAAFNSALIREALSGLTSEEEAAYITLALHEETFKFATFDSRVFTIPDRTEVENYLIWRQQDAVRNSIQMAAQAIYSQKELHGHSCDQLQEMLFQKGVNWNDYCSGEKRGRAIVKESFWVNPKVAAHFLKNGGQPKNTEATIRSKWVALTGKDGGLETPNFAGDKEFLRSRILLKD